VPPGANGEESRIDMRGEVAGNINSGGEMDPTLSVNGSKEVEGGKGSSGDALVVVGELEFVDGGKACASGDARRGGGAAGG